MKYKSRDQLAVNDLIAAKRNSNPIYEVKSNGTTLELSPTLSNIRKAVANSISCIVYCYLMDGRKYPVIIRQNRKMIKNHINLQVNQT